MSGHGTGGHQNFHGFSHGSGSFPQEQKINLNLEDVVLHEQKLCTILDVKGRENIGKYRNQEIKIRKIR